MYQQDDDHFFLKIGKGLKKRKARRQQRRLIRDIEKEKAMYGIPKKLDTKGREYIDIDNDGIPDHTQTIEPQVIKQRGKIDFNKVLDISKRFLPNNDSPPQVTVVNGREVLGASTPTPELFSQKMGYIIGGVLAAIFLTVLLLKK